MRITDIIEIDGKEKEAIESTNHLFTNICDIFNYDCNDCPLHRENADGADCSHESLEHMLTEIAQVGGLRLP